MQSRHVCSNTGTMDTSHDCKSNTKNIVIRTINAIKTCSAAIQGPWTHLMTANQIQRTS